MGKLSVLKGAAGGGGASNQLNVQSADKVTFMQSAAPVGWTKQTTHNDKVLRVVSGSAGSGGSQSFTTCFGSGKASQSHTLTTPQLPVHTHSHTFTPKPFRTQGNRAERNNGLQSNSSGAAGGSGAHSHSLDLDVNYVDIIIAAKD